MGNCCFLAKKLKKEGKAPTDTASPSIIPLKNDDPKNDDTDDTDDDENSSSSAVLIEALLPLILPIIRIAVSKRCVDGKIVQRHEVPIEELDEDNPPIGPLEFSLGRVSVLDLETIERDATDMPEFSWPEQERWRILMESAPRVGRGLVVLDVIGSELRLGLEPGVEIRVPVIGPLGVTGDLEVGAGGSVDAACVRIEIPRVRLWIVPDTGKIYVVFMERPNIVPNLHVNADLGNGDIMDLEFIGKGSLDNVMESVLCGFGPSSLTMKEDEKTIKTEKKMQNWIGNALGETISQFAGIGNNRPLVIDLHETIKNGINIALGIPRPAEVIRADIKVLEEELAATEQSSKKRKTEICKEDVVNITDDSNQSFFLCN